MARYIAKRLLLLIPVLFGISVIVFLIMAMIPGDPALAILGAYATPDSMAKLNAELGLDKPLLQQYFIWLGNLLTGDFGRSYNLNRPVLDEVLERLGPTLLLASCALLLCTLLGILA
ncbi:MAG: ABC transporter permease, partial [Candidatus Competibacteraceae bacterium]|nr:ABC transporter permease [Candidatus Competibacteraceae bacterium]